MRAESGQRPSAAVAGSVGPVWPQRSPQGAFRAVSDQRDRGVT